MSLFLTLMLQFAAAAAAGQPLSLFTARVGHDFTMPCGNVTEGHCNSTTWLYSNTKTVALFEHGRIHNEAEDKSDRLSLTASCSLVIKEVKVEDAGRYTCRQNNKSGKQQGSDLQVDLPVMDMTKQKFNNGVVLSCSVWTHELCRYTLKWLYKGEENASSHRKTSSGSCFATVTITTSDLRHHPSLYELMTCEVTDDDDEKVQLFPFSPQSSGEDATTTATNKGTTSVKINTTERTNDDNNRPEQQDFPHLLRYIFVSVGLAALVVSVVTVNLWAKIKGRKTKMEGNPVHSDEDDEQIYENVGDPSASVRLH